jgi:hypothetical protein
VIVPVKLLLICNHISSRVGDNEFSIVTDIKERTSTEIKLSDTYYIPKQTVARSAIEYQPDSDLQHKVVIHRHPDGFNTFSGTDHEYINQNFELSILYTRNEGFVNGIYNHKMDEACILQLPLDISVDYALEPIDISNITIESDIFRRDILKRENKLDDIMIEKFNGKSPTSNKDNPLEDLENRVFVLEETVFYNTPADGLGHF